MNCKKGDLAIVVRSGAGNEGKIVKCIRYVGRPGYFWQFDDYWLVDQPLKTNWGDMKAYASDSCLRPLRGDLSSDQVMERIQKPLTKPEWEAA